MRDDLQKLWAQLPEHKSRFEQAKRRYDELRSAVCKRWREERWATGPVFSLEPFGLERMSGRRHGRALKARPKVYGGKACLRLSADGNVLCEERYLPDGTCYEEFLEYELNQVRSTLFDYYTDKDVINVQSLALANGIPVSFLRYAANGVLVETYSYDNGRLHEAHTAVQERAGPRAMLMLTRDTFTYGDPGQNIVMVTREWDTGEREIIFPG